VAALLRERGYEVTKRDEQGLAENVDGVTAKLDAMRQRPASPEEVEQSQPPRDPEHAFGEALLGELNRSRTRWYVLGETGGDDGPQAA
jgi:hypothetical protein